MLTASQPAHPTPSTPTSGSPAGSAAAERTDLACCRETLRNGSRTFLAASLLLPRAVREPASALYAFCRLADDAVDQAADGGCTDAGAATEAVARLRERLARACHGEPDATPADRALAAVLAHHAIPRALPEALLDGFAWDAAGRRYETLAEVHDYAARVAGSVGAMMALLMGVRSAEGLARACDLGVAMQLSNIARDVGEDARIGRLYLPRQWLREAGIDPDAWLALPRFDAALGSVVQRLLTAADELYARVGAGVACLPWACRPGINAARLMYADIGHEVARRGLDSVSQRAVVPGRRKAWLLARALTLSGLPPSPRRQRRRAAALPPLDATRFLVDAVTTAAAPAFRTMVASAPVSAWNVRRRALWLIELFERLEQREQLGVQRGLGR